jgi:hypothetical protein
MPLLGELKKYALMDLSYTINTRSTCHVSSIGLRNLVWKFSTILAVNFLSILVKDDPRKGQRPRMVDIGPVK